MSKRKKIILWSVLGLVIILSPIAFFGGRYYMEKQRAKQLYQHGFKLYEEQIATYITEHYSGVSKVEFSPIFIRRGGMSNGHIVPVIYDEYGNRELLGESGRGIGEYALHNGLELDRDGATDEEIIELVVSPGHVVEVQGYEELPDKAKIPENEMMDNNISKLVKQGYLKGIKKDSQGSPKAKISYNLEIKEGDYQEWH